jgi:hypothetical protein
MDHRSGESFLTEMRNRRLCPQCRKFIPSGSGVGTGRIKDGLFCCLDCYAKFYYLELQERASRQQSS